MLGKQRAVCRERSSKHASDIATEPSDSRQQFTSPVYSTRQVEPFRRPIKSGGTLLNFSSYEFLEPFHLRNQIHSGHDCRLRQFRRTTSCITCPPFACLDSQSKALMTVLAASPSAGVGVGTIIPFASRVLEARDGLCRTFFPPSIVPETLGPCSCDPPSPLPALVRNRKH